MVSGERSSHAISLLTDSPLTIFDETDQRFDIAGEKPDLPSYLAVIYQAYTTYSTLVNACEKYPDFSLPL